MPRRKVWNTGWVPDRTGMYAYVELIRGPDDPKRSPRVPVGDPRSDTMALWRKELLKSTVADWIPRVLFLLADGVPRTLNRIAVELLDKTADVVAGTPLPETLWTLALRSELHFTTEAPILFRRILPARCPDDAPTPPPTSPAP